MNSSTTLRSQFKLWSLDLFCELLAHLANIRFLKVIDHFILELEKVPDNNESALEALAKGLQFVKVPIYPIEAFEEGSNFLWTICAKYVTTSDSIRVKFAFAHVMVDLCSSIAEVYLELMHLINFLQ